MSDSEDDSNSKTVTKSDKVQDNENKSEENSSKKRQWTTAREIAWQKCLDGRKEYLRTRQELIQKEQAEKTMKQKIREEMIRKKIRAEIEAEMKKNGDDSSDEESKEISEEKEEKISKKKTKEKKKEESETENDDSENDEELLRRKRARTKNTNRQVKNSSVSFTKFAFV